MTKEKSIQDLEEIKNIMDKSTRFSSISGLSGILAGSYLLAFALLYKFVLQDKIFVDQVLFGLEHKVLTALFLLLIVFILSVISLLILTHQKTKSKGESPWNTSSRRLLINFLIPFLTGIVYVLLTLGHMDYSFSSSLMLIFYGLTLVNGSKYTIGDLRSLGVLEILTGFLNLLLPAHSFWIFVFGFGILNIIYGCILHLKYDRQ